MSEEQGDGFRGMAAVFDRVELKNFFVSYITAMLVIEGLIFFVCFVSSLATDSPAFPWKPYLFASFMTPVALTFLFGVIILIFNKYLLRQSAPASLKRPSAASAPEDAASSGGKFFAFVQQVPLLLSLLLLLIASAIAYQLDAIALFTARAGEQVLRYLLLVAATLVGLATLIFLVWMVLSYDLRRRKLTLRHQYRQQVTERCGLVLLDDDTVIDQEGRPVHHGTAGEFAAESDRRPIPVLPKFPD